MTFRYLSVCSGIEAASLAFGPLGALCKAAHDEMCAQWLEYLGNTQ